MDRAQALQQQIQYYQQHQQQLLGDIQRGLYDASSVSTQLTAHNLGTRQFRLGMADGMKLSAVAALQGQGSGSASDISVAGIQAQIQTLGLLSHTRSYGEINCPLLVAVVVHNWKSRQHSEPSHLGHC